jgi:ABC-2 type transport system permease protein
VSAAAPGRILLAQTGMELRLTLRRGESLLLTLVIPLVLLGFFSAVHLAGAGIAFLVPGILALAVMSTAFTGQAIATGYERAYGILRRLGATPLSRPLLLCAKTLGVVAVEVLQAGLVIALGFALGWHPHGSIPLALAVLVLGTAAFSSLGLLLAGTLRAEATLAAANGIYLVLLLLGGVVFPLHRLPAGVRGVADVLPTAALSSGLRSALAPTAGVPLHDVVVLAVWAVAGLALTARLFRWEPA